jgi:regulatory protein
MVDRSQSRKNSTQPSLRTRALRMLVRREHSRLELQRKLEAYGDTAEIEKLLDEFARQGWLSESRVLEQLVHARRGKFGSRRIRQELIDKGVAGDLVDQALPGLKEGDFDAARAIWRRKFGKLPGNISERARQTRFLLSRGFTADVIRRVLRDRED